MMNKNYLLVLIIILGLFLRLPYQTYFYGWDESIYMQHAEIIGGFKADNFDELELRPPMLSILIAGAFHVFHSAIMANLLVAILGTASIYLIYRLGELMFNEDAGMIAAALLAFWPFHIFYSTAVLTHVPAIFFVLLFFYLLKLGEKEKGLLLFAASGASLAACILTRFTYLSLLPLFAVNIIVYRKKYDIQKIMVFGAAFFAVLVPYLIWSWITFEHPLYTFWLAKEVASWSPAASELFYLDHALLFLGPLLTIGIISWTITKLKEKFNYEEILLLAWMIISLLSIQMLPQKDLRYLCPIAVPLVLICSSGVGSVFNRFNRKLLLFFAIILFSAFFMSAVKNDIYLRDDTIAESAATSWLKENMAPGDIVYSQWAYTQFAYNLKNGVEIAPYYREQFFNQRYKYMNYSGYYVYFEWQANVNTFPTLAELKNDSQFKLIKEIDTANEVYIFSYAYP